MTEVNYTYKATVLRVIDGDTLDLQIDLGFRMTTVQRVRLLGINTPEITGINKDAGIYAKMLVQGWCADAHDQVVITTHKSDSFGRWLAEVYSLDVNEVSLTEHLLGLGYSKYEK